MGVASAGEDAGISLDGHAIEVSPRTSTCRSLEKAPAASQSGLMYDTVSYCHPNP